MNVYDKIVAYGHELQIDHLDIDMLIGSHRVLRENSLYDRDQWLKALDFVREKARQEVLDSNWIHISKLKTMTIKELTDFIQNGDADGRL